MKPVPGAPRGNILLTLLIWIPCIALLAMLGVGGFVLASGGLKNSGTKEAAPVEASVDAESSVDTDNTEPVDPEDKP